MEFFFGTSSINGGIFQPRLPEAKLLCCGDIKSNMQRESFSG
jgi:hypothetical protein